MKDSGLLGYLLPIFESTYGYTVEVQSAGTQGNLCRQVRQCDLILVHAKSEEEAFVEEGFARTVEGFEAERISFLYNYFVLCGPSADPAGVKEAASVLDAFAAIAEGEYPFISRGDVPAPTPRSCPCGLRLWVSRRRQSPSLPTRSGTPLQTPVWAHVW